MTNSSPSPTSTAPSPTAPAPDTRIMQAIDSINGTDHVVIADVTTDDAWLAAPRDSTVTLSQRC